MKKLMTIILALLSMAATACADNDKIISQEELPAAAKEFIAEHFAQNKIIAVKLDNDLFSKDYEVLFEDRTTIKFDKDGKWTEIECKMSSVPDKAVPVQILEYVMKNYPDALIKQIDRDRKGYDVELSNKIELEFNKKFELRKIDL